MFYKRTSYDVFFTSGAKHRHYKSNTLTGCDTVLGTGFVALCVLVIVEAMYTASNRKSLAACQDGDK